MNIKITALKNGYKIEQTEPGQSDKSVIKRDKQGVIDYVKKINRIKEIYSEDK